MINKSNAKCKGCGGNLVFSPSFKGLYCENCKSTYKIDAENSVAKNNYENIKEEIKTKKTTNCTNCGAQIDLEEREITKTCPYCNSNFVVETTDIQGLKPDLIVPFNFDKQKAIEYYKSGVKKKFFLPNKFKKSPNIDSISGTYISCFSFDCDTKSKYSGTLSRTEQTVRNGKTYSHTYTQHISGNNEMEIRDYIIESSKHTNQYLFDQIKPYNIDSDTTFKYNPDFLRGYTVESYDNSLNSCKVLSEEYIKEKIKNAILSKYNYDTVVYFNMSTDFSNYKYSYILLPMYFIDFKYNNKNYKTYINGQTGKIGNDLPKSKVKIFFLSFFIILFIALIILLSTLG